METLVFLFPGRTFTKGYAESWEETLGRLLVGQNKRRVLIIREYSSDIYNCRNALLLPGSFLPAPFPVKPYGGKLDYDRLIWIDSDMVWKYEDLERLLAHDVDIVTGACPIDFERIAAAKFAEKDGKQGLGYFNIKGLPEIPLDDRGLAELDFTGFAFTAVKKGVFEAIEYPWFRHEPVSLDGKQVQTSEDFGMCKRIKEAGFKIYLDPSIKIGHEKTWTLRA